MEAYIDAILVAVVFEHNGTKFMTDVSVSLVLDEHKKLELEAEIESFYLEPSEGTDAEPVELMEQEVTTYGLDEKKAEILTRAREAVDALEIDWE